MYRFKTKAEFEREFGEGWQDRVHLIWARGHMDHLFGVPILNTDVERVMKGVKEYFKIDSFKISKDMITEDKNSLILKRLKSWIQDE